jgi:MoaA/NifB/PqqE/SkfB family radical SAM enzyme
MTTVATNADRLRFVWLEVTERCNLSCIHCYASSGPRGSHGAMTAADWRRVVDEAAELGVRDAQLIGGEPTLHPAFPEVLRLAVNRGMSVEVYTNLVRVTPGLWDLFGLQRVSLAVSYYSTSATTHDAITRRRSHDRTLSNIREAARRSIPLRIGIVRVSESQDVEAAVAELEGPGETAHGCGSRSRRRARPPFGREVRAACGTC